MEFLPLGLHPKIVGTPAAMEGSAGQLTSRDIDVLVGPLRYTIDRLMAAAGVNRRAPQAAAAFAPPLASPTENSLEAMFCALLL